MSEYSSLNSSCSTDLDEQYTENLNIFINENLYFILFDDNNIKKSLEHIYINYGFNDLILKKDFIDSFIDLYTYFLKYIYDCVFSHKKILNLNTNDYINLNQYKNEQKLLNDIKDWSFLMFNEHVKKN